MEFLAENGNSFSLGDEVQVFAAKNALGFRTVEAFRKFIELILKTDEFVLKTREGDLKTFQTDLKIFEGASKTYEIFSSTLALSFNKVHRKSETNSTNAKEGWKQRRANATALQSHSDGIATDMRLQCNRIDKNRKEEKRCEENKKDEDTPLPPQGGDAQPRTHTREYNDMSALNDDTGAHRVKEKPKPSAEEAMKAIREYNALFPEKQKQDAEITPILINRINQYIAQYKLGVVLKVFEKAKNSAFLSNSHFISLDWILRQDKFIKIKNGDYDDSTKVPPDEYNRRLNFLANSAKKELEKERMEKENDQRGNENGIYDNLDDRSES